MPVDWDTVAYVPGPGGNTLNLAKWLWPAGPGLSTLREAGVVDRAGAVVTRPRRTATKPSENGTTIMKLTVTTNVSVDGVMQGLGGSEEDRRGGFERGGWAGPLLDTEAGDHINEVYGGAAAFLFGRRTYETFAGSWGAIPEMSTSPIGVALNGRPKYVVSASLTAPQWAGTTVLSGDVAAAVGDLKAQHDGELVVPGSGALVRWLLAHGLVDQFDLLIYPVVIGQGTRLFPGTGPDNALELVTSRSTAGGITIQNYRLAGRPQYAT